MKPSNEILLRIENNEFTLRELVSIFRIAKSKININSFAGMAKSQTKAGIKITKDGVRKSSNYLKEPIGDKVFAIAGLRDTNDLPWD